MPGTLRILNFVAASLAACALAAMCVAPRTISAQTGAPNLEPAHEITERALGALRAGNLTDASAAFAGYEAAWSAVEDDVRDTAPALYAEMEGHAFAVRIALEKADAQTAQTELTQLESAQEAFISGAFVAGAKPAMVSPAALLGELAEARAFQSAGVYDEAAKEIGHFQKVWLQVEGQVKTRNAEVYRATENDIALALTLLKQQSPESGAVLTRMAERLEPFAKAQAQYGPLDAAIIVLREGLEALLVIVALLAFLRKSGNAHQTRWVWAGVAVGLAASIAIGLAVQAVLQSVITPENRELIEGVTSLAAAGMLIYMGYWMHSKSSTEAWNRYIKQRSTKALAAGSLLGIAALAFLSIFREGAETAIFFIGMAASITVNDLLLGLAIGGVTLAVLGVLLVRLGARLPIGLFFGVASVLVFYLCFKFVGVGIHALQVANVLPATSAEHFPESSLLGMFPTWETFVPQMILLGAAIVVVVISRVRFAQLKRASAIA